jgi:hypothetical protein
MLHRAADEPDHSKRRQNRSREAFRAEEMR